MQVLHWLSVLVFGLLVSAQQSPPTELDIKTTHTPSDCTSKANKGDAIKVHYVRRELSAPHLALRVVVYFNQNVYRPENYFPMATNLTRGAIRDLLFALFAVLTRATSYNSHDRGQPLPLTRAARLTVHSARTFNTLFTLSSRRRSSHQRLG